MDRRPADPELCDSESAGLTTTASSNENEYGRAVTRGCRAGATTSDVPTSSITIVHCGGTGGTDAGRLCEERAERPDAGGC